MTAATMETLKEAWASLSSGHARRFARDVATDLRVSEGQLVAAGCGTDVIRLKPHWVEILNDLPSLGQVKVITRNEVVVHEKIGSFGNINISGTSGVVYNGGVDLRLFLGHWHHGFHVTTQTPQGPRQSLQFFDLSGTSIHKVFLTEQSDTAAFDALVQRYRSEDQSPQITVTPAGKVEDRPDSLIDVHGLRAHWSALNDVHHFHEMLREFGVGRVQALRLIGEDFAHAVPCRAVQDTLMEVISRKIPIMVFVGNTGCIQIHTGPIQQVVEKSGWLNILDPEFNLHVQSAQVTQCWVVRKPSRNGVITTLELYDCHNENVALFAVSVMDMRQNGRIGVLFCLSCRQFRKQKPFPEVFWGLRHAVPGEERRSCSCRFLRLVSRTMASKISEAQGCPRA